MTPLLLVPIALAFVADAAKVPSNWKTCKRNLPPAEYDPCISSAVSGAVLDILGKGAPNLGIPPLEPLKITALHIGQGTGPVAVDLKLGNLEIANFDSVEIKSIRHKEAENYKFGADIVLKKPLIVNSQYDLAGKVLVLPIKGKGDCHLEFDNMRSAIDLSGVPYQKGSETYANITRFEVNFDTDKLHLRLDNLFDGNKELGDNMNVFLNDNWDVILKELKPAIMEALSEAFRAIANQIFSKIPYNKLIPAS